MEDRCCDSGAKPTNIWARRHIHALSPPLCRLCWAGSAFANSKGLGLSHKRCHTRRRASRLETEEVKGDRKVKYPASTTVFVTHGKGLPTTRALPTQAKFAAAEVHRFASPPSRLQIFHRCRAIHDFGTGPA
ncbi:hypothetical protein VTK56DRAFT_8213 [Thermocarpiscus australiensis]